jgi:hypothetical protein
MDFHERNAWRNGRFELRLSYQRSGTKSAPWEIMQGCMCWGGGAYEPWKDAAGKLFASVSDADKFCEQKGLTLT